MAYVPPTRSAFRTIVLRALRDPNGQVFPAATVNDFIHEALMDLSAYRPDEMTATQPWTSESTGFPSTFVADVVDIWQMVARVGDLRVPNMYIPHADYGDGRSGWDFLPPNILRLGRIWLVRLQELASRDPTLEIAIYGYRYKALPSSDASYLDLNNPVDQFCVTQHCKMLGFQMLNADRALYQQWLAATNNTDVSPTQLAGMLTNAEASYDRARHRNTIIRRRPTNAEVVSL